MGSLPSVALGDYDVADLIRHLVKLCSYSLLPANFIYCTSTCALGVIEDFEGYGS